MASFMDFKNDFLWHQGANEFSWNYWILVSIVFEVLTKAIQCTGINSNEINEHTANPVAPAQSHNLSSGNEKNVHYSWGYVSTKITECRWCYDIIDISRTFSNYPLVQWLPIDFPVSSQRRQTFWPRTSHPEPGFRCERNSKRICWSVLEFQLPSDSLFLKDTDSFSEESNTQPRLRRDMEHFVVVFPWKS